MYSIHWIRQHRHDAFKSSHNLFVSRLNNGRIKRNAGRYDIYFPANNTTANDNDNDNDTNATSSMIGSTIQKAFLFYPESLVDITSYSNIMSKLSDLGICIIVVNCDNPSRIVTPYHKGGRLNDCFKIIYEIEVLMGITVKEWVLGGHGDGATVALELRRLISLHKMKKKKKTNNTEGEKAMKCVLWGLSSSPRRFSSSLRNVNDTLFITASNDSIAGNLRLEHTLSAFVGPNTTTGTDTGTGNDGEKMKMSYYNIDGGNHSAFGHYGPQSFPRKDGPCVKTIEKQQKECWMRTLDFILEREPVVGNKKD